MLKFLFKICCDANLGNYRNGKEINNFFFFASPNLFSILNKEKQQPKLPLSLTVFLYKLLMFYSNSYVCHSGLILLSHLHYYFQVLLHFNSIYFRVFLLKVHLLFLEAPSWGKSVKLLLLPL